MNDKTNYAKWEFSGEDGTQQLLNVTGQHNGVVINHLCKYLTNILLISILIVSIVAVTMLGQLENNKSIKKDQFKSTV